MFIFERSFVKIPQVMFSLFAKSYINTLLNLPCHVGRHNTRRVSLTVKAIWLLAALPPLLSLSKLEGRFILLKPRDI